VNLSVYLAAPFELRPDAIRLMHWLEARGVTVTSTWLRQDDEVSDMHARQDLADVDRADVLVALNPPEWSRAGTGGRHVEFGYAVAKGKRIVLCGSRSNMFHHLSDVVRVTSEEALLDELTLAERLR
jgi:nucleoside 2-deoxyribosyltransferase